MKTNNIMLDALILVTVLSLATQAYCIDVSPLLKGGDGFQFNRQSEFARRFLSCSPINKIPDDPPEKHFPTSTSPLTLKGDTGVAGTSGTATPSPSPSA